MGAHVLLTRLQKTLAQLEEQNITDYSIAERQNLHKQLISTIKTLHDLYPDGLNQHDQQRLIGMLLPLERQLLDVTLVSSGTVSQATWHNIHNTLQSVIARTLSLFT